MTNEVIVERLNTLIEQNTTDHNAICKRLDFTNGRVKSLTIWRAVMLGMGTVITGAVIPLVLYIAMCQQKDINALSVDCKQIATENLLTK